MSEYKDEIIEVLDEHGAMTTSEIARRLNVSPELIWRDLRDLWAIDSIRKSSEDGTYSIVETHRDELPLESNGDSHE